jgi:hypothetical protein
MEQCVYCDHDIESHLTQNDDGEWCHEECIMVDNYELAEMMGY